MINKRLIFTFLLYSCFLHAASITDSILEIPAGSIFELRNELEIPANRDFIVLGKNRLNDSFNQINQTFNQLNDPYPDKQYYHYNDYLYRWQQSVNQSYQDCLERHRVFYSYDDDVNSNNIIINNGSNNTNVIINKADDITPSYGSYISHNACIKPEHTLSVLLVDKKASGAGGVFRSSHQFKVKSVRQTRERGFNVVTVYFDHEIATGIQIITTQSPEDIQIAQLQYRESGDGFFEGLGNALAALTDIGGHYFNIKLAEKRYYD